MSRRFYALCPGINARIVLGLLIVGIVTLAALGELGEY